MFAISLSDDSFTFSMNATILLPILEHTEVHAAGAWITCLVLGSSLSRKIIIITEQKQHNGKKINVNNDRRLHVYYSLFRHLKWSDRYV